MHNLDYFGESLNTDKPDFSYRGNMLYLIYKRDIEEEDMFIHLQELTVTNTRRWEFFRYCRALNDDPVTIHFLIYFNVEFRTEVTMKLDYGYTRPKWMKLTCHYQWINVMKLMNTLEDLIPPRYRPYHFLERFRKPGSKGEEECRRVLQNYFNRYFTRDRLRILTYSSGRRLEIDCLNVEVRVGAEYNGRQHYERVGHWDNDLISGQQRDLFKIKQCKKHNIYLIIVPYTVPFDDIESYLIERLKDIPVPPGGELSDEE